MRRRPLVIVGQGGRTRPSPPRLCTWFDARYDAPSERCHRDRKLYQSDRATHGGQVKIPFLYQKAIHTKYPFVQGLYKWSPVPVFVTSGVGETGVPFRFLNPPVIDILDLH